MELATQLTQQARPTYCQSEWSSDMTWQCQYMQQENFQNQSEVEVKLLCCSVAVYLATCWSWRNTWKITVRTTETLLLNFFHYLPEPHYKHRSGSNCQATMIGPHFKLTWLCIWYKLLELPKLESSINGLDTEQGWIILQYQNGSWGPQQKMRWVDN